jgi:hypothetical protein
MTSPAHPCTPGFVRDEGSWHHLWCEACAVDHDPRERPALAGFYVAACALLLVVAPLPGGARLSTMVPIVAVLAGAGWLAVEAYDAPRFGSVYGRSALLARLATVFAFFAGVSSVLGGHDSITLGLVCVAGFLGPGLVAIDLHWQRAERDRGRPQGALTSVLLRTASWSPRRPRHRIRTLYLMTVSMTIVGVGLIVGAILGHRSW